jgi:serpin B
MNNLGDFTCNLYHKFDKDKNLFFSGYSISTAISLAYLGAKGETKKQLSDAMGYSPDAPQVVQALVDLGKMLNTSDGKIETKIGNAIWVQKGLDLSKELLNVANNVCELIRSVDYENSSEEARKEINEWVAEVTSNIIKDLIPEDVLDRTTGLVLTNAIYFNGKWAEEFNSDYTLEKDFYNLDETASKIDSMFQKDAKCRFCENETFQFAALPYGDKDGNVAEMHILLPKKEHFEAIDKDISYSDLKYLSDNAKSEKIYLSLPKFKLRYKEDIANKLAEDMPLAFSDDANFSGLTEDAKLKISNIVHEAVVEVTEKGTEAAAATAVVMECYGACVSRPINMNVNRPFIFSIWDVKNSVPMFMGRVTNLSE